MVPPPLIVVLRGPTAAGKSAAAMALGEALGAEIVSADSRQVIRGLDIGTAKPSAEDRARVPHHLLDLVDPGERFSAGEFQRRADAAIADIHARGRLAVVCGGTGLYLRALLEGLAELPEPDLTLRAELNATLERDGAEAMHARLRQVDPDYAEKIAPADRQRILRALEVFEQTGRPFSSFHDAGERAPRYAALDLVVRWPREALHARIAARVDAMLAAGLEAEAERERSRYPAVDEVLGYSAFAALRRGEITRDALAERIARDHRRYARRQITWLRGVPGLRAYDGPLDIASVVADVSASVNEAGVRTP